MKRIILEVKYGNDNTKLFGMEQNGKVAYSDSGMLTKKDFMKLKSIGQFKPFTFDNALDNGNVMDELKAYIKYHNKTEPEYESIKVIKTNIINEKSIYDIPRQN